MDLLRILFLGDVVAKNGKAGLRRCLKQLKVEYRADLTVVNGENSAGGIGIDVSSAKELFSYGADYITLGDHAFHKKDSKQVFKDFYGRIVRPANFPVGVMGQGYLIKEIIDSKGQARSFALVNLLGKVFIDSSTYSPFDTMRKLLDGVLSDCDIILVDFHAETTSEKLAFVNYFDGFISAILGTHTHVQTNDARIFPSGTGYITDVGMCGPLDSVIGMEKSRAIKRFVTGLPVHYKAGSSDVVVSGVFLDISYSTGHVAKIETFQKVVKV